MKNQLRSNKGSGLGVILYGMTVLLVLVFVAVNIVNAKVVQNGYDSLRDAVQTASYGSVIHLLSSNRSTTTAQNSIIEDSEYDIYLQLALGYIINRENPDRSSGNIVQSGDINNFIKLDHQKVVNTTLALFDDIARDDINNTDKYKIMMFFIEPYYQDNGKKFFNIIAYGNGDYDGNNITRHLATDFVLADAGDMRTVYNNIEWRINNIIDAESFDEYKTKNGASFSINLNTENNGDYNDLIRQMETYPHYLIVVKDFALPTIFSGKTTSDDGSGVRGLFSKDASLKKPMCALNTGKIQRQTDDEGWSKRR